MNSPHRVLFLRFSAFVIGGALFVPALSAQFGTENIADQDIGRPPQPPLITLLGIVNPGKLATDPSLPLKGPVAEVLYEELRGQQTPAGPAGEITRSIRTTYSSEGHPVDEVRSEFRSQSITISQYVGKRLVSQESTSPTSKTPLVKSWNYWTYDQSGKLTEYRRGRGDELQNHVLNFKRDGAGRLIGFEYRQGARDEPFSRTAVRYSDGGKTAEFTYYDEKTGHETRSMTQTVDDRGLVVQAEMRELDSTTKKPEAPVKVTFRYDEKGRVVEQNTDAREVDGPGSEDELPPGKVSISYDDAKHTKTTEYSSPEGRLALTLTFDGTGATVGVAGGAGTEIIDLRLDCGYDSYGNWTVCRRVGQSAGVSAVGNTWRRTIRYR